MQAKNTAMLACAPECGCTFTCSAPKSAAKYKSLDEVDPEILETYKKLGIPLREQEVLLGVEGAPDLVDQAMEEIRIEVEKRGIAWVWRP